MDGAPAIGIDLGTTYSCVAVWLHNRVEIILNEEGKRTTPSCVAFDDAERFIGNFAKNGIAMNDPANTISGTKRLIGRRFSDSEVQADMKLWPFKVIEGRADTPKIVVTYKGQEKEFFPEEIYSMVLANLKQNAEYYLGKDVKNAVVTVPVYFNESQRQATKDAATIAGINVIHMISEPAAAAIAYGLDKKSDITGSMINVLVFNLGGSTFEVSVLTIGEGGRTFEVKAVASDTHLGGEDFDNRMVEYCVEEFKRRWSKDLTGNKRAMWRLGCACEQEKWFLSNRHLASIFLKSLHERIDFSIKISRDTFEKLNMDFFNKCMEAVKACLNDAKMEKSCVDEVILVGGSTRIPKIRSMLKEFFENKELCMSLDPQEVIARGAAVMATKITSNCHKRHRDMFLFTNVSETTQEDQLPCKMRKLTITNKNGTRLSKEEIEKMIQDAEMYKMELEKADAIDALRAGIHYRKKDMCPKMACAIAEATKLLEHKEAASLDELLRMNHHIRSV